MVRNRLREIAAIEGYGFNFQDRATAQRGFEWMVGLYVEGKVGARP
jgi:hypothetical protein